MWNGKILIGRKENKNFMETIKKIHKESHGIYGVHQITNRLPSE